MKESDILHQTENLYCVAVPRGVEIRLHQNGYSLAIGVKPDLESAKALCAKLERYPKNLKHLAA